MRLNLKNIRGTKKGISMLEYVTVIVIIVSALLAMRFYLKRSISGSFRSSGDAFGQGRQYEPGVTVETKSWN